MGNLTVLILFTRQPKFDVILWLMNKVILESFLMICTNHCPLLCSNVRYLCMFPHDLPFFLLYPFAFHSFRSMYSVCFACAGRIVYFCYSNHFIFLYRCYAFAKFFVRLYFHGHLHHDIVNTCIITDFIQPFVAWLNTFDFIHTSWASCLNVHLLNSCFFLQFLCWCIDRYTAFCSFIYALHQNKLACMLVKKHDISIELDWTKFLIYFY